MRVIRIIEGTSVDGPGLRTSIYFAGCRHNCVGCHNPETWDFNAGNEMSVAEILKIIKDADFNVTFTGGDPLYQLESLIILADEIKKLGKTIWCYTGFLYEDLLKDSRFTPLLQNIDVIVDGPFLEKEKDITLPFRGSRNQRIIKLSHQNTKF